MVVWGETSLQRTADVVNPVDLRSHMMGVDDWEDFKKGLWMFRGFYETSLANDLTFEIIWVPCDFKELELAPEGTVYNSTYTAGFFSILQKRWRRDAGRYDRGLSDSQGGFRIRGYNWDWDWTFLYYNGYFAGPILADWGQRADSYRATTPVGFALQSGGSGIGGFNLWAAEKNISVAAGSKAPAEYRVRNGFKYYRVHNFGFTGTKFFNSIELFGKRIPTQTMIRFEFAYARGVPFNKQGRPYDPVRLPPPYTDDPQVNYGRTFRDTIAYGIEISRDFMPQFICKYNGQRSVDVTFSIFQDWILKHKHYLSKSGWNRGVGDSSKTFLGLSFVTDWFKQELRTQLTYGYDVDGNGYVWAHFLYAPGDHWRFVLLPRYSWSNAGPGLGSGNDNRKVDKFGRGYYQSERDDRLDYIHLKIEYLF
jgi:hypothetical protein